MQPKPFDKNFVPFVKCYLGDFAKQVSMKYSDCDSVMLAFQHERKFDIGTDCYFICFHRRDEITGEDRYRCFTNALDGFGLANGIEPFDSGADVQMTGCEEYLGRLNLRAALEVARMFVFLRRWMLKSKGRISEANRSLGFRRRGMWVDWITHAVLSASVAVNCRLERLWRDGVEVEVEGGNECAIAETNADGPLPGVTYTMDGEKIKYPFQSYTDELMRGVSAVPRWNVETRPLNSHPESRLFLVRRNPDGVPDRVFACDPEPRNAVEFRLVMGDVPRGEDKTVRKVVAAAFDEETRKRCRLLRQDVCEISGVASSRDGEYLVVTNDDGEKIAIEKARALSLFTE